MYCRLLFTHIHMCSIAVLPFQTSNTHPSTHRAQPAVVNAMKKRIEVVAHTFSSIRSHSIRVPLSAIRAHTHIRRVQDFSVFVMVACYFRCELCERLINSNSHVRYYNWHFHTPTMAPFTRKSHRHLRAHFVKHHANELAWAVWHRVTCRFFIFHPKGARTDASERTKWKKKKKWRKYLKFEFRLCRLSLKGVKSNGIDWDRRRKRLWEREKDKNAPKRCWRLRFLCRLMTNRI